MLEEVHVAEGDSVGTKEWVLYAVNVAVAVADDVLLELAVLLDVAVKVKTTVQGSHWDGKTLMTISP